MPIRLKLIRKWEVGEASHLKMARSPLSYSPEYMTTSKVKALFFI